jgi:phosphoribosylaminoimidazole (AIR) synthetase
MELGGVLADELLRPTEIYVRPVLALLDAGVRITALAHLTGDGLFNLPRTRRAVGFDIEQWPEPAPIFRLLQRLGDVPTEEMFRAFNMGIGFIVVVAPESADAAEAILGSAGVRCQRLGRVTDDAERTIQLRPYALVGRRDCSRQSDRARSVRTRAARSGPVSDRAPPCRWRARHRARDRCRAGE